MSAVGIGVRGLLGPLARRLPALTATMLVVVGLWTICARVPAIGVPVQGVPTVISGETLQQHVQELEADKVCCDE